MKYFTCLLSALLISLGVNSQKTVRMDAVKGNNYGVTYSLPKSALAITINYSKRTKTAGEFYMYSERYLNISNPIAEDEVIYELTDIDAKTIGVPDAKQSYLVEFRPNSATAYVTLTQDGMICAINTDYTFPTPAEKTQQQQTAKQNIDARQYFTEEILRAGSSAKQAELIAKQIYKIRASRNDILTGEADNMPPDGEAYKLVMKQLDEQEKALSELFVGREDVMTMKETVRIDLTDKDIKDMIVARFSKKLGVVEPNNLAGAAIRLNLKTKESVPSLALLSDKEMKEREKKFSAGIIYNIPGKGALQIEFDNKVYVDKECDIVQFGTQDVLDNKPFGDKNSPLQVVFYPELGAIKQTGTAR